jgi:cytochrome c nitrite reductase small subunit
VDGLIDSMRFAPTAIVAAAALVGVAGGLGLYTFVYAKGYSYITNDPAACANCHVMNDQYDGWLKSSHRAVAVCNDCHVPHDLVGKYKTKGENGFWHSYYFTTQSFAEPSARRRAADRRGQLPALPRPSSGDGDPARGLREISCIRCRLGGAPRALRRMPPTRVMRHG